MVLPRSLLRGLTVPGSSGCPVGHMNYTPTGHLGARLSCWGGGGRWKDNPAPPPTPTKPALGTLDARPPRPDVLLAFQKVPPLISLVISSHQVTLWSLIRMMTHKCE